ncbi:MAG: DUF1343 domain-containing protein [Chloroflexi bacterium]|nr:DUF1343 domain-containing protein [Chloroflexota bacterium]
MPTLTGLDVLLNEQRRFLKNQRVGLITNPTGITRAGQSNTEALREIGVNLVALFSPEHGLDAAVADAQPVPSRRDARTGLPVHSLYGDTRRPTAEMLGGMDTLLFDLQDVGARFYTFTTTLALALAACAENRLRLIVLDRPNPIGGSLIEGPMLSSALQSFIGHGPLPIRYGMTIGELAQFYNRELNIGAELAVVTLQGWARGMWFDETGLLWPPPSPGIPHWTTTIAYPGMCLIEGTNVSEGRGTPLPFETAGAPWLDGYALAEALNAQRDDGVHWLPMTFVPDGGRHAGQVCGGVQIHVTDREAFRPVMVGLRLIAACRAQNPAHFEFLSTSWEGPAPHLDLLTGTPRAREAIENEESLVLLAKEWESELARFQETRNKYLLY